MDGLVLLGCNRHSGHSYSCPASLGHLTIVLMDMCEHGQGHHMLSWKGLFFFFLCHSAYLYNVFYVTKVDAQVFLLIQLCFPLQIGGIQHILPMVSVGRDQSMTYTLQPGG